MSDDLRAAALIVLTTETAMSGYDPWTQSHFREPKHSDKMRLEAARKLATAHLAEHPEDENELVTIEWLESIPGIDSEISKSYNNIIRISADKFDCIDLKFIFVDDNTYEIMLEEWVIYQGPVQTRREVRNMLAVFGIKERP